MSWVSFKTWSWVHLPFLKPACSAGSWGFYGVVYAAQDKALHDFEWRTEKGDWPIAFRIVDRLIWLGDCDNLRPTPDTWEPAVSKAPIHEN